MPATITVLYPNVPDSRFDMDYYLSHHMPLGQKEMGTKAWRVSKIVDVPGHPPAPYQVQAVLEFSSVEEIGEALTKGTERILADIPNFTDTQAVILVGEVVGSS